MLCGWKTDHGVCRIAIPATAGSVKEHIQALHGPPNPPQNKADLEKVLVRCQWEHCSRADEPMQFSNLSRHICSTHPDVSIAVKANKECSKCQKVFPRIDAHRRHEGTCCICKLCRMEFRNIRIFEEHKNRCPMKLLRARRTRNTKA